MGLELKLTAHNMQAVQSFYLAKAGIIRTITELYNDPRPDFDTLKESWGNNKTVFKEYHLGPGSFTVNRNYFPNADDPEEKTIFYGAEDEQSKININQAPYYILVNLFELLDEDREIAANIIDWRDKDSIPGNNGDGYGAEDGFYEGLGKKYPCKNKPIEILDELLMVKDITPELFNKIKPYITIYGEGTVNINTAPPIVLLALGLEKNVVDRIIEYRAGEDGIESTFDDRSFVNTILILKSLDEEIGLANEEKASLHNILSKKPAILDVKSTYFTISATGTVSNTKKYIEVVLKRKDQTAPEILFWQEN